MSGVVITTKATLTWSPDGRTVTKVVGSGPKVANRVLAEPRAAALNEIRINRLLLRSPPPVATPRLLASSRRPRSMTFDAVPGEPLGPKFPTALDPATVHQMIRLVDRLSGFNPRRRWFRRLDVRRRLGRHVAAGLLDAQDAEAILRLGTSVRPRFAHGDVTARNVLRDDQGHLVLIDWEWAGLYPTGYERAFLWFSVVDVPGARAAVERSVPDVERDGFLLSALLIQLLHLHMWLDRPPLAFIGVHEQTLMNLLQSLQGRINAAR